MINSMLQSGLSLAGNLYSPKSVGAQKEAASSGGSTWGSANYNYNGGNSSIRHFNSGTRGFEYAAAGTPIYQQRQLGKYKLSW